MRTTFCDLWADAGLRVDRLGAPGASALLESPLCLGHIDCPCREGSTRSHITPQITMMWATSSGVCLPMACPAHDSEAFCADETRMGKAWYIRGSREMGRWEWVAQSCLTPWTTACQALLCRNSLGKNTGVGCHALLQEIFPTQGLNPGFLHCKQTLIPETPEKPLRCTKFRFRTRQSKMTAQRKFGMTHISDSSYHKGGILSEPVCVPIHICLFSS